MNLFGIGPMEIIFILLLAVLIFGPKDIGSASKTVGRSLNKLVRSDTWRSINQASSRLKNLPNELMREAGLEDLQKDTNRQIKQAIGPAWSARPAPDSPAAAPAAEPEHPAPVDGQTPDKEGHA